MPRPHWPLLLQGGFPSARVIPAFERTDSWELSSGLRAWLPANGDSRPFLDMGDQGGEVLIGAALAQAMEPELLHRVADPHRHPERVGLVDAQLHVLGHEAERKAEIEAARQDRAREFVLGRGVAP